MEKEAGHNHTFFFKARGLMAQKEMGGAIIGRRSYTLTEPVESCSPSVLMTSFVEIRKTM